MQITHPPVNFTKCDYYSNYHHYSYSNNGQMKSAQDKLNSFQTENVKIQDNDCMFNGGCYMDPNLLNNDDNPEFTQEQFNNAKKMRVELKEKWCSPRNIYPSCDDNTIPVGATTIGAGAWLGPSENPLEWRNFKCRNDDLSKQWKDKYNLEWNGRYEKFGYEISSGGQPSAWEAVRAWDRSKGHQAWLLGKGGMENGMGCAQIDGAKNSDGTENVFGNHYYCWFGSKPMYTDDYGTCDGTPAPTPKPSPTLNEWCPPQCESLFNRCVFEEMKYPICVGDSEKAACVDPIKRIGQQANCESDECFTGPNYARIGSRLGVDPRNPLRYISKPPGILGDGVGRASEKAWKTCRDQIDTGFPPAMLSFSLSKENSDGSLTGNVIEFTVKASEEIGMDICDGDLALPLQWNNGVENICNDNAVGSSCLETRRGVRKSFVFPLKSLTLTILFFYFFIFLFFSVL